jgi:hypothetical protein
MKTIAAGVLSAALVLAIAGPAHAADKRNKDRQQYDTYSQRYPNATPRQLKNLRAYERGEYYETYSDALPVGSQGLVRAKRARGWRSSLSKSTRRAS